MEDVESRFFAVLRWGGVGLGVDSDAIAAIFRHRPSMRVTFRLWRSP